MPDLKPGKQKNKPVNASYNLEVKKIKNANRVKKMNDPIFEKLVFYIVNNDPQGFSDLLKKYPLEINTKERKRWTLFHYAAEYQNVSIGKELLSKGADINAIDDFGNNVLWRATFSSKGKGEFIQFLIENGVDKFAKNNNGISPMDLAGTIDNYNVKQFLDEK